MERLDKLAQVYCNNCALTGLHLSDLPKLRRLSCSYNPLLQEITLERLDRLEEFYANNCSLARITLLQLPRLCTLGASDNLQLQRLPDGIFQLLRDCRVMLFNCTISREDRSRCELLSRQREYEGPHIDFEEDIVLSTSEMDSLKDLLQAVLHNLPEGVPKEERHIDNEKLRLKLDETQTRGWLMRVLQSRDFNAPAAKQHTALRILHILQHILEDDAYSKIAETILNEGTGTCTDRATLSLSNLEIAWLVHKSGDMSLEDLIPKIRGLYILDILEKEARRFMRTHIEADEVEVYLALRLRLKEEFKLPIEVERMTFFSCSQLKESDIEHVRQVAIGALQKQDATVAFFVSHDLWQKALADFYLAELTEMQRPYLEQMSALDLIATSMTSGGYKTAIETISKQQKEAVDQWFLEKTQSLLGGKEAASSG